MKKANGKIIFKTWMQRLIKIILICSTSFLTILLSNRYDSIHILIGAILSFIIAIILFIKIFKVEEVNIKKFLLITFISLYTVKTLLIFSGNNIVFIEIAIKKLFNISLEHHIISKLLGLLSLPSVIFFEYLFLEKIAVQVFKFKKSLTKVEKRYLLIMFIISIILSVSINTVTNVFSKPFYNNELMDHDVIYTSDSGLLTVGDAYFNVSHIENDLRQPLFGIFSLPFAIISKLLSEVCFFLPVNFGYVILLTIIQFVLTTLSTIMIGKMLKLEEKDKKYLYLLFSLSFPYILFNIVLEQYVIALFYLILALYIYSQNKDKINYMYVGAVGTLLTSGVILPAITRFKNVKNFVIDAFKCFLVFMSTLIIGGQFPQVITLKSKIEFLSRFTKSESLFNKICQFTHFVEGLFFPQDGEYVLLGGHHHSYQLLKYETISIAGILILATMFISFVLNRKNKMAKISILWVLFSIIILLIGGWGTKENGLVLYSLYFSWSYYVLYFLLIKKLFRNRKIYSFLMIISISLIASFSIFEFINILKFGITYY